MFIMLESGGLIPQLRHFPVFESHSVQYFLNIQISEFDTEGEGKGFLKQSLV
tara:strand:+ start:289 stop:444 length:156 start_codon:yes stop_codon:yes gene_type:complete